MTLSTRYLSITFAAAGLAAFGLAAAVTIRADQAVIGGGGAQIETRIVTDGARIGGPGLAGPAAQPMSPGTGLIFGQATDANGGRPVAGVLVTLTLPGATPLRVLADGQGRYAFRDLPKGTFNLSASKGGYVDGAYGRMRPQGQTQAVELADGERLSNINVALWKYAAIAGQVVDESGEPMVGATVRVLRKTLASGKPRLTMGAVDQTDDRGAFRIGSLEPGDYIVCVPIASQGALMQALESLARSGSGGVGDIMAFMPAGAAGGGAAGVGGPVNISFGDSGPSAGTSADGRPMAYSTVFYPAAATAARATIVTLGSGEERSGVDFQLRPARTARISGAVISPTGPAANLTVTLVPTDAEELASPLEATTAAADANGTFTFPAVTPGQYTLRVLRTPRMAGGPAESFSFTSTTGQMTVARMVVTTAGGATGPLPTDPTLWAEQPVSVDATDVTGVALTLRTGLKVSGQVEFTGMAERPAPDRLPNIGLTLEPADTRTSSLSTTVRGRVETTGTFTTMGAVPGRYFVRATGAPQGWFLRGATLNGRDVTDQPLDLETTDVAGIMLTFTDKQTEIAGTVTASTGTADASSAVIAFPAERDNWTGYGSSPRRLRNVRTDAKGAFTIRGLPPGRYNVVAVRDAVAADWQDPKFLEAIAPSATTVDLMEGQKSTQALKVVR